jgi:hypothetical protein
MCGVGIYQRNCEKRILQLYFFFVVDLLRGYELFEVIWIFRFVTLKMSKKTSVPLDFPQNFQLSLKLSKLVLPV